MATPNEVIKQTSKAILFGEFNTEKVSLKTILKNEVEGHFTDSNLKTVKNALEVESFEEFMEKFEPTIYQMSFMDETGTPTFIYTPENDGNGVPVSIAKQSFYEMVQDIIRSKSSSGESNIEFDYRSRINKLLSPETELKRAKELRKDVDYNYRKMLEANDNHRSEETKKCKKKCSSIFNEITKKYDKNAIALLPLAIADVHTVIETKLKAAEAVPEIEGVVASAPVLCDFGWDENGTLVAKNEVIVDNEPIVTIDTTEEELLGTWENVAKKIPALTESEYMRNTFLSCYTGNKKYLLTAAATEELVLREENYVNLYKNTQENFLNAVAELVQKVLDVEMFFKHATDDKGRLKANSKLIVANCSVSDILSSDDVRGKFSSYIKKTDETSGEKIWFAMLPPVYDAELSDDDEDIEDHFDNFFGETASSAKKAAEEREKTLLTDITQMTALLNEANIISFFNFKASEKTGFTELTEDLIDIYKDKLSVIKNDCAVFTYPNFTVIPKVESEIEINKEIKTGSDLLIEKNYLKIPAIYVNSAFVACGLVVSSQNPEILEKKKYTVLKDNPSIRFDFEEDKNKFTIKTMFNRETVLNRTSALNTKIIKEGFGFCFSCDERFFNGTKVENTYVQIARNTFGKQLYKVIVKTYINKYISTAVGSKVAPESKIKLEVENFVGYCKRQIQTNPNAVNRIFYSDSEQLEFSEGRVFLKFNKQEDLIDIEVEEKGDDK